MEIEVWKDIPEYEGLYQVSSFGRVKSFKCNREKIMIPQKSARGYLRVGLRKLGKYDTIKIHVLVAMAFHGHVRDGMKIVVDHIDNNKLNNHADNLKLIPQRENASKDRKGVSEYTGVFWCKKYKKWGVKINFKGRSINLGSFELEIDASNAYQKAKKEWEQGLDLNILYPKRIKTSKYKGVTWDKKNLKWVATYNGKWIGRFKNEFEAIEAIEKYIKQYGQ